LEGWSPAGEGSFYFEFQVSFRLRNFVGDHGAEGDFNQLAEFNRPFKVVGLDAPKEMIEVCNKKAKGAENLSFDVAAAEKLPYEDNSFDVVISTFFFHHKLIKTYSLGIHDLSWIPCNGLSCKNCRKVSPFYL